MVNPRSKDSMLMFPVAVDAVGGLLGLMEATRTKIMVTALKKRRKVMPNLRQPPPSVGSALAGWYVCVMSGSFTLLPNECWTVDSTYSDPQPSQNPEWLADI
jgi:hypothetical protein